MSNSSEKSDQSLYLEVSSATEEPRSLVVVPAVGITSTGSLVSIPSTCILMANSIFQLHASSVARARSSEAPGSLPSKQIKSHEGDDKSERE